MKVRPNSCCLCSSTSNVVLSTSGDLGPFSYLTSDTMPKSIRLLHWKNWINSCAVSFCSVLHLPRDQFQPLLSASSIHVQYCRCCFQHVQDLDFTFREIEKLRRRLESLKKQICSIVTADHRVPNLEQDRQEDVIRHMIFTHLLPHSTRIKTEPNHSNQLEPDLNDDDNFLSIAVPELNTDTGLMVKQEQFCEDHNNVIGITSVQSAPAPTRKTRRRQQMQKPRKQRQFTVPGTSGKPVGRPRKGYVIDPVQPVAKKVNSIFREPELINSTKRKASANAVKKMQASLESTARLGEMIDYQDLELTGESGKNSFGVQGATANVYPSEKAANKDCRLRTVDAKLNEEDENDEEFTLEEPKPQKRKANPKPKAAKMAKFSKSDIEDDSDDEDYNVETDNGKRQPSDNTHLTAEVVEKRKQILKVMEEHPTWSLSTLQKNLCISLKHKSCLKRWKKQIEDYEIRKARFTSGAECVRCARGFKQIRVLRAHLLEFHSNPEKLVCVTCDMAFHHQADLANHELLHGELHVSVDGKDSEPIKCLQCPSTFITTEELKVHTWWHLCKDNYCRRSYCRKYFQTPEFLSKHSCLVRPKSFVCEECGKAFENTNKLRRHKLSHSSEKTYKCKLCSTSVKYAWSLSLHMKVAHTTCKEEIEGCAVDGGGAGLLQNSMPKEDSGEGKSERVSSVAEDKYYPIPLLTDTSSSRGLFPAIPTHFQSQSHQN